MTEKGFPLTKIHFLLYLNPIDPNPAVAARVVFPQSGRIFFHIFSKRVHTKNYPPGIGVQYIKLKALKCRFKHRRNCTVLINSYI